jgi:hypothetical protein
MRRVRLPIRLFMGAQGMLWIRRTGRTAQRRRDSGQFVGRSAKSCDAGHSYQSLQGTIVKLHRCAAVLCCAFGCSYRHALHRRLSSIGDPQPNRPMPSVLFHSQTATLSDIAQYKEGKQKGGGGGGVAETESNVPMSDLEIPPIRITLETDTITDSCSQPRNSGLDSPNNDVDFSLSGEGKLVIASLKDTNYRNRNVELSKSRQEGDAEERSDSTKVDVDVEGEPTKSTASAFLRRAGAEAIQAKRSLDIDLDIEDGADMHMLEDTDNEDEEQEHQALDSLPAAGPRARQHSTLSSSDESSTSTLDHDVCPICLGSYKEGNMLFASKHCAHIFHGDCILEWLTNRREDCPICRVQMVTEEEMVASAMALVAKTTTSTTTS